MNLRQIPFYALMLLIVSGLIVAGMATGVSTDNRNSSFPPIGTEVEELLEKEVEETLSSGGPRSFFENLPLLECAVFCSAPRPRIFLYSTGDGRVSALSLWQVPLRI